MVLHVRLCASQPDRGRLYSLSELSISNVTFLTTQQLFCTDLAQLLTKAHLPMPAVHSGDCHPQYVILPWALR